MSDNRQLCGVVTIRNKVTEKQAIQLTWANWNSICEFVPRPWFKCGVWLDEEGNPLPNDQWRFDLNNDNSNLGLLIQTLESNEFLAKGNDWIIRGLNGEFYACKPDIFEKSYEIVTPSTPQPSEEPCHFVFACGCCKSPSPTTGKCPVHGTTTFETYHAIDCPICKIAPVPEGSREWPLDIRNVTLDPAILAEAKRYWESTARSEGRLPEWLAYFAEQIAISRNAALREQLDEARIQADEFKQRLEAVRRDADVELKRAREAHEKDMATAGQLIAELRAALRGKE